MALELFVQSRLSHLRRRRRLEPSSEFLPLMAISYHSRSLGPTNPATSAGADCPAGQGEHLAQIKPAHAGGEKLLIHNLVRVDASAGFAEDVRRGLSSSPKVSLAEILLR